MRYIQPVGGETQPGTAKQKESVSEIHSLTAYRSRTNLAAHSLQHIIAVQKLYGMDAERLSPLHIRDAIVEEDRSLRRCAYSRQAVLVNRRLRLCGTNIVGDGHMVERA